MSQTEHSITNTRATVLVLSGNSQTLSEQVRLATGITSVNVVATDERMIRRFREMLRLIRNASGSSLLCFGCSDLELQRFQVILKSYLLLSGASTLCILDERGRNAKVTVPAVLLFDIPRFLFELAASAIVIVVTSITLFGMRFSLRKRTRKVIVEE
ncbi:MAG: hypothetical protein L0Y80_06500 [Ignavibacteriae bacterium]|nr:hypothetical protein [Ignavibacteriota bacterium]